MSCSSHAFTNSGFPIPNLLSKSELLFVCLMFGVDGYLQNKRDKIGWDILKKIGIRNWWMYVVSSSIEHMQYFKHKAQTKYLFICRSVLIVLKIYVSNFLISIRDIWWIDWTLDLLEVWYAFDFISCFSASFNCICILFLYQVTSVLSKLLLCLHFFSLKAGKEDFYYKITIARITTFCPKSWCLRTIT